MLRFYLIFFLYFFLLLPTSLLAQCNIEGPRNGCVNDIITFTFKSSQTVSSYNWNFGTYGNTSTAAPSIKVTATGNVLVTCEVVLSNNAKCKDTHLLKIHPNPTGKLEIDPSSNLCANGNKLCLKDASTIGAADIERITVLWYDGSISKVKKPLSLICRSFPGAGNYQYNLEVADDFGCKHSSIAQVKINPNPKIQGKYTALNYCDSIAFCFDGASTGGTAFTYTWFKSGSTIPLSNNKIYCKTMKAGENGAFKCVVKNEFGCPDSSNFYGGAPIRNISGKLSGHKFCMSDVKKQKIFYGANEILTWSINGYAMGSSDTLRVAIAFDGWNYVKGKQLPPCKGELNDSFFITDVTASAIGFNVLRHKVLDTCFFLDVSRTSPGTKIYRLWSFRDTGIRALPCTTDTKKNINAWTNCNFSKDSLTRHYYHGKFCFSANLYLMDSVTGCYSDTTIQVFRHDYCDSFISPRNVCLGHHVVFKMSAGAWAKSGIKNTLYTDIAEPKKVFNLTPSRLLFVYTTVGYKSPVFTRNYGTEVVWKESKGTMVVDSLREVGWVTDTFHNAIKVNYMPDPTFTLGPTGSCPPWKIALAFESSEWFDPDTMVVDWGDTVIKYHSFSEKVASLDTQFHSYHKSGYYTISVELIPKQGCRRKAEANIGIGSQLFFRPLQTCNWRNVCFKDSVKDLRSRILWNANFGQLYWNFGNGTTDSGYNPCGKYAKTGKYTVVMTAVGIGGCRDSVSREIELSGPVAVIADAPLVYCSEIHTFKDSSWWSGTSNGDSIKTRIWNFGDGTPELYGLKPSHIYPFAGKYTVRLVIITAEGCSDTTYQELKVIGPIVSAKIVSDSFGCPPLGVFFQNNSKQCGNYIWQFGDPDNHIYSTLLDTGVQFTYTKPGVYYAKLIGADSFYNPSTGSRYFCSATYPKPGDSALRIEVYPSTITDFSLPDSVCPGMNFEIKNTSLRKTLEYAWNVDGKWSKDIPFESIYSSFPRVGNYRIGLFPEIDSSDKLCADSTWKNLRVVQHETRFAVDCERSDGPFIYLQNHSGPAADIYRWTEMEPKDSSEMEIAYSRDVKLRYDLDTGKHILCLSARDSAYCLTKACSAILVNKYLALANVFTPGADGFNDVFRVPFGGHKDYEFQVFNRYGERVFHTTSSSEHWNGRVDNIGAQLPAGSYFYQLFFQEECEEKRTMLTGSITLLR